MSAAPLRSPSLRSPSLAPRILKEEREKEGLVAPGNGCLEPEDMEQSQEQMFFFQIVCATIDNNKIILNIDNSRMTADDFRVK